jgi:hypothetical protein
LSLTVRYDTFVLCTQYSSTVCMLYHTLHAITVNENKQTKQEKKRSMTIQNTLIFSPHYYAGQNIYDRDLFFLLAFASRCVVFFVLRFVLFIVALRHCVDQLCCCVMQCLASAIIIRLSISLFLTTCVCVFVLFLFHRDEMS